MGLRVIFFSASARFFVAAAKDLSAKQRIVRVQHAARKLRVCYTHTNTRQTYDGMCVPTTDLDSPFFWSSAYVKQKNSILENQNRLPDLKVVDQYIY